jgi:hypothetical protein
MGKKGKEGGESVFKREEGGRVLKWEEGGRAVLMLLLWISKLATRS